MTDAGFIDPFGDDSDLLQQDFTAPNPEAETINMESPLDGELLSGLPGIVQSTSWLNDMSSSVLEQENANVETEAMMYAMTEIVGEERMDELLTIARHRQRAQMWEQISEVFKLLVNMTPPNPSGDVGIAAVIVARKSAETLYNIAVRCHAVHQETYDIKKGEYEESRIMDRRLSFNFWVTKAPDVLDTLRHKISMLKKVRKN